VASGLGPHRPNCNWSAVVDSFPQRCLLLPQHLRGKKGITQHLISLIFVTADFALPTKLLHIFWLPESKHLTFDFQSIKKNLLQNSVTYKEGL
jgi:hypothetical protein